MTPLDYMIQEARKAGKSYGAFVAEQYEITKQRIEFEQKSGDRPKCVICGKDIPLGKKKNAKVCGDVCTQELNRRNSAQRYRTKNNLTCIVKKCENCGKEFTTVKNNKVYCSGECQSMRYRVRRSNA